MAREEPFATRRSVNREFLPARLSPRHRPHDEAPCVHDAGGFVDARAVEDWTDPGQADGFSTGMS